MNVLVIKLGALGDMVQAIPAFQAIRRHHLRDNLILLTTKPYVEFVERMKLFNEIWVDERIKLSKFFKFLKACQNIKKADLVYDLQMVDRTWFYYYLGTTKKTQWIGSINSSFINVHDFHPQERYQELLSLAGIKDYPSLDTSFLIDYSKDKNYLAFHIPKPYALIVPGASNSFKGKKKWPYYKQLVDFLKEKGITPVLIGAKQENDLQGIDLTGQTTFFDILVLANEASFSIGNDTGPMHLIASMLCPSLVLFSGFTNPKVCSPKKAYVLQEQDLKDLSVKKVIEFITTLMTVF